MRLAEQLDKLVGCHVRGYPKTYRLTKVSTLLPIVNDLTGQRRLVALTHGNQALVGDFDGVSNVVSDVCRENAFMTLQQTPGSSVPVTGDEIIYQELTCINGERNDLKSGVITAGATIPFYKNTSDDTRSWSGVPTVSLVRAGLNRLPEDLLQYKSTDNSYVSVGSSVNRLRIGNSGINTRKPPRVQDAPLIIKGGRSTGSGSIQVLFHIDLTEDKFSSQARVGRVERESGKSGPVTEFTLDMLIDAYVALDENGDPLNTTDAPMIEWAATLVTDSKKYVVKFRSYDHPTSAETAEQHLRSAILHVYPGMVTDDYNESAGTKIYCGEPISHIYITPDGDDSTSDNEITFQLLNRNDTSNAESKYIFYGRAYDTNGEDLSIVYEGYSSNNAPLRVRFQVDTYLIAQSGSPEQARSDMCVTLEQLSELDGTTGATFD